MWFGELVSMWCVSPAQTGAKAFKAWEMLYYTSFVSHWCCCNIVVRYLVVSAAILSPSLSVKPCSASVPVSFSGTRANSPTLFCQCRGEKAALCSRLSSPCSFLFVLSVHTLKKLSTWQAVRGEPERSKKPIGTLSSAFNTVPNSLDCELHREGIEIWWWRALVSIKLKCLTRSDYCADARWVYTRLRACAFTGKVIAQQFIILWLSPGVDS